MALAGQEAQLDLGRTGCFEELVLIPMHESWIFASPELLPFYPWPVLSETKPFR